MIAIVTMGVYAMTIPIRGDATAAGAVPSAAFGAAGGRLQEPLRVAVAVAVADGAGAGAEAGFDGGYVGDDVGDGDRSPVCGSRMFFQLLERRSRNVASVVSARASASRDSAKSSGVHSIVSWSALRKAGRSG
jgi:hypothetical protein